MINSRFEKRLTISIQNTNNRDRKYQEPMQEKKQKVREKEKNRQYHPWPKKTHNSLHTLAAKQIILHKKHSLRCTKNKELLHTINICQFKLGIHI